MFIRILWRVWAIALLSATSPAKANDEVISLNGNFGSFISLGATVAEVDSLGPDRVQSATPEQERINSSWYYFTNRSIRVRVCSDDQRVATVNAGATQVTRKYVTETGLRIGDSLEQTRAAYGERLQLMPESDGAIWFVDDRSSKNRLTFGFSSEGRMRWVALGSLRVNGWTCGQNGTGKD